MPKHPKYILDENNQAVYKCPHCSEKFKYRTSLKRHILKSHNSSNTHNENEKKSIEPVAVTPQVPMEDEKIKIVTNANLQDNCEKNPESKNLFGEVQLLKDSINQLILINKKILDNMTSQENASLVNVSHAPHIVCDEFNKSLLTPASQKTLNLSYESPIKSQQSQRLLSNSEQGVALNISSFRNTSLTPYDLVSKERHIYIERIKKIVETDSLRNYVIAFLAEHGDKKSTVIRYYTALKEFVLSFPNNKIPDYEDWLHYVDVHKERYIDRTPENQRNQNAFQMDLKIVAMFLKKYFGFKKLRWPVPFPLRPHPFVPDPVLIKDFLNKIENESPILFTCLYIMYLTGIRPVALMKIKWGQITDGVKGPIIKISYTGKYDKGSFEKPIPDNAFKKFMKIKQELGFKDDDNVWQKSRAQLNKEMKSFTLRSNTTAIKCSTMRKAHANTIMQAGVAEICKDALKHQSAITTLSSYLPDDWRKLFILDQPHDAKSYEIVEKPISKNNFRTLQKKTREARKNAYENSRELELKTYKYIKEIEGNKNLLDHQTRIKRLKRKTERRRIGLDESSKNFRNYEYKGLRKYDGNSMDI